MTGKRPRVLVVGDVLLDRDVVGTADRLCPDAPVPVVETTTVSTGPGGAGLTALLCRHDPEAVDVGLLAPVARDVAGEELLARLNDIDVVALGHEGRTRMKTRIRAGGQSLLRVDEGGPGAPGDIDGAAVEEALAAADVVLVSDYGGGITRDPGVRRLLTARASRRPVVWDPHSRGGDPVPATTLVTPNESEARAVLGDPVSPPDTLAADVREVWGAAAVAVTVGHRGAFLATESSAMYVPVEPVVEDADTCGAGDSFAASATVALATGASVSQAVIRAAGDARRWVHRGGVANFRRVLGDSRSGAGPPSLGVPAGPRVSADLLAERVHREHGTLVATGGCFDLLHAGHIATLESARRLGDALIVLLNSDASVRRLKGPGRPAVPAADRARMLLALRCVDAVEVFDDDTPVAALRRLRPTVWVKGGDYRIATMPEAEVLRSWGGRVILLPLLPGRSTTALLTGGNHE